MLAAEKIIGDDKMMQMVPEIMRVVLSQFEQEA